MGQPANVDPSNSGWNEVLKPHTIKKMLIEEGHVYPLIND